MYKDFLVKPLDIRFNFDWATEYLDTVEYKFAHLKWKADNNIDSINDAELQENIKGVYGWGIQSNLKDLSIPCPPYNIHKQGQEEYKNTQLVFGFAEWLLDVFPYARQLSMAAHPPGTQIRTHVDSDTYFKIHIPLVINDSSYFIFDNEQFVMKPGKMYLVNTAVPHSTINKGTTTRVHLFFKVPIDKVDEIVNSSRLF
jgi:mannose-6-phosphate isomerase-like protein (cupin superfamily)